MLQPELHNSIAVRNDASISPFVPMGCRSWGGKPTRVSRNEGLLKPMLSIDLPQVYNMEAPLPGYSVEILQWEVPVSLDGRTVMLNGDVQQVHDQLLEINPRYEEEFGTIDDGNTTALREIWRTTGAMERQHDAWSDCGHWDPARAEAIWEGINHLNHVSGRPVSKPGPGVCGRVSCSYESAIWWCNDVSSKPPIPRTPSWFQTVAYYTYHSRLTAYIVFNRVTVRNHCPRITKLPPQSSLLP